MPLEFVEKAVLPQIERAWWDSKVVLPPSRTISPV